MRVLLLSGYDALSHQYWREQLARQFPSLAWTVLAAPPRHFSYRLRGGALDWYHRKRDVLTREYDLVIATSLVDIACLRGLLPALAQTPLWLYCHENQFSYPVSAGQQSAQQRDNLLQAQLVFLYGCLCADAISFNSAFNRDTALAGIRDLLQKFPTSFDGRLAASIAARSDVLPVPLEPLSGCSPVCAKPRQLAGERLQILWNHRWEYDKGPEYLLAFARYLAASALPATLHVAGQQFRERPPAFDQLQALLNDAGARGQLEAGQWGFVESQEDYLALLGRCDVVVSTARHEFQGLAVLQAVQAGCSPLVPDRLVYPEQFEPCWQYAWHDDPDLNARAMLTQLQHILSSLREGKPPPCLASFCWPALEQGYRMKLQRLAGQAVPAPG